MTTPEPTAPAPATTPLRTEPVIRFLAGTLVLTGLALAHWVHPNWLWLSAFVGANLLQSAFTGFCPAEMILRGAARGHCPIVCAIAKRLTKPA